MSCSVDWREVGQKGKHSVGLQGLFELVVAATYATATSSPPAADQSKSYEFVDSLGRNFTDLTNQLSEPSREAPQTPAVAQPNTFYTPRSDAQERPPSGSSSAKRSILKSSRLELSSLDGSSSHRRLSASDAAFEDPARIFAPQQPSPVSAPPLPAPVPRRFLSSARPAASASCGCHCAAPG